MSLLDMIHDAAGSPGPSLTNVLDQMIASKHGGVSPEATTNPATGTPLALQQRSSPNSVGLLRGENAGPKTRAIDKFLMKLNESGGEEASQQSGEQEPGTQESDFTFQSAENYQ